MGYKITQLDGKTHPNRVAVSAMFEFFEFSVNNIRIFFPRERRRLLLGSVALLTGRAGRLAGMEGIIVDSQPIVQDAIRGGATAGSHVLRSNNLDTAAAMQRADDSTSITSLLVQLPGVNLAYRVLKDWHGEFTPRVYGEQAVLIQPSRADAQRRDDT